jgi:hypothetical protein
MKKMKLESSYQPVIEYLFVFNHDTNNFESDLTPRYDKNIVFSMKWLVDLATLPGCKLHGCRISPEEADELNQLTKDQPHHVLSRLLGRIYPKNSLDD